jgi:glycosyltransferase involved in cell wall biosynthesis
MDNDKYSIIVPTRNRKYLLLELIRRIDLEDERLIELIIVDSSDKNFEAEIINLSSKINFVFTDVRSASIQRNIGVEQLSSQSKYVFFLDDDVKPDTDYFNLLLATIKVEKAIGASGIAIEPMPQDNLDGRFKYLKKLFLLDSSEGGVLLKSAVNIPIQSRLKRGIDIYCTDWLIGCSVWDVEIFAKTSFPSNFFGQSLGEDVLFSAKAKKFGKLLVNSKIILEHKMSDIDRPNKKDHYIMWVRNRYIISKELRLSKFNLKYHWCNLGMLLNAILLTFMRNPAGIDSIKGIFLGYKSIRHLNET